MHKQLKFFVSLLLITILHPKSGFAQETITGKYCEKYKHYTEIIKEDNAPCEEPAFIRKGDLRCVTERTTTDYLNLRLNEDGSLEFALSLWFPPHAHYCGITGQAQPTNEGWVFQENMAGKSDDSRCILNITHDDNKITFKNDLSATCKNWCGYYGNLNHIEFPRNLREATEVMDDVFSYEYYMVLEEHGGPSCKENAKFSENVTVKK